MKTMLIRMLAVAAVLGTVAVSPAFAESVEGYGSGKTRSSACRDAKSAAGIILLQTPGARRMGSGCSCEKITHSRDPFGGYKYHWECEATVEYEVDEPKSLSDRMKELDEATSIND